MDTMNKPKQRIQQTERIRKKKKTRMHDEWAHGGQIEEVTQTAEDI